MSETLLDVAQAAKLLGVHEGTLYKWVRARRVPAIRVSPRVIRFDRRALEGFFRANTIEVREA